MRSCLSSELRRHWQLECNLRGAASRYRGCSTTAFQYTGLTFRTFLRVFVCCKDLATNSMNCLYSITETGLFTERYDLNLYTRLRFGTCHEVPGSICGGKSGIGTDSSQSTSVSPPSIVPPMLHAPFPLHVAQTRRINGRSVGTSQKAILIRKSGSAGQKALPLFSPSQFEVWNIKDTKFGSYLANRICD